MAQKFADIHVHSSLKPFNNKHENGTYPTLWEKLPQYQQGNGDPFKQIHPILRLFLGGMARTSQANLDECVKGNLLCPFLGLYPAERKFFDAKENTKLDFLIKKILPEKKRKYLAAAVTGFPVHKVVRIFDRIKANTGIDYFNDEFLKLIDYVVGQQGVTSPTKDKFKIATDYDEYKKFTSQKKTITGILTVEGVSSLGHYRYHKIFDKTYSDLTPMEKKELANDFRVNIEKTKNLNIVFNNGKNYTPFFISFSHHFNNLLAGHSKSLSSAFSLVLEQKPGMDEPFNRLGLRALHFLLSKKNGRRILIDTKHMSILSRKQYHGYVKKRKLKGDDIPIICSHSAINGSLSFNQAIKLNKKKDINTFSYFYRAAVNLNDEEILDIFDSDGLIGLVLHEGRMPGGGVKKKTSFYKIIYSLFAECECSLPKILKIWAKKRLRHIYSGLIWSNIFHIIRLIRKKRTDAGGNPANGWKIISLGSDYDGTMDPFNSYETVNDFPDLATEIVKYLNDKKNPVYFAEDGKRKKIDRSEITKLCFGKDIKKLVDDLFWNNVDNFLKKYFTDKYLK